MSEPEVQPASKVPMIPIAICIFIGGLVLMVGLVMLHQASQPKPEEEFYYHPPARTVLPSQTGDPEN